MKKSINILIAITLVSVATFFTLSTYVTFSAAFPSTHPEKFTPSILQTLVEDKYNSSDEPEAKDSAWFSATVFGILMISDGTRRDDYTESVCQDLYYGFEGKGVVVKAFDMNKLAPNEEDWIIIGESDCDDVHKEYRTRTTGAEYDVN